MAKKRRKLNKDFERKIYASKKNVELVLAKIYDIDDEDIQKEYMSAFNRVVHLYDELKEDYDRQGFNDNSDALLKNYNEAINLFECLHHRYHRFLLILIPHFFLMNIFSSQNLYLTSFFFLPSKFNLNTI